MTTKEGVQTLVVDDERSVRRAIRKVLEQAGHQVWEADGAVVGLEQLVQRSFDLVITDFALPGMDGELLVARMRQMAPAPSIIMAMAFPDEYKVFGQPAGNVDALLLKPFTLTELEEAIRYVSPKPPGDQPTDFCPEDAWRSCAPGNPLEGSRRVNDYRPCLFAIRNPAVALEAR